MGNRNSDNNGLDFEWPDNFNIQQHVVEAPKTLEVARYDLNHKFGATIWDEREVMRIAAYEVLTELGRRGIEEASTILCKLGEVEPGDDPDVNHIKKVREAYDTEAFQASDSEQRASLHNMERLVRIVELMAFAKRHNSKASSFAGVGVVNMLEETIEANTQGETLAVFREMLSELDT